MNDIDISIGDKVLFKNETGHKLDSRTSNNKNKKQTVHKVRLKNFIL